MQRNSYGHQRQERPHSFAISKMPRRYFFVGVFVALAFLLNILNYWNLTHDWNVPVSNYVPKEVRGFCPPVIRKKVGVFDKERSNSAVKDKFPDTVLLVSANYAYYDFLQNWEWLAYKLGLKWAVLALDEDLYNELGPERAIPSGQNFTVSGEQTFRKGQFNILSCNKMNMALEIANKCGVNVVFSDVDNIFLKNPFEHDLGNLIRSNRYDYLYQPNTRTKYKARENNCIKGLPSKEANTGFYYIRHGNEIYKRVVEGTMKKCLAPDNHMDDQTLFWKTMWQVKREMPSSYQHCGYEDAFDHINDPNGEEGNNLSFRFCCMDSFYYPNGHGTLINPDPVTYHANFVKGRSEKIERLKNVRKDGYGWNANRTIHDKG